MHRRVRFSDFLAKVAVPLERQVFDAVSLGRWGEAQGLPIEVEEVLAAERAFIELLQDEIPDDGDLTNGLARLLTLLRLCAARRQKADQKKGAVGKEGLHFCSQAHSHDVRRSLRIQQPGREAKLFGVRPGRREDAFALRFRRKKYRV